MALRLSPTAADAALRPQPMENPLAWGIVLAVTLGLLWVASMVLWLSIPVILTSVLYYFLSPICDKLRGWGMSHNYAVLATLLGVSILVLGAVPIVARATANSDETGVSHEVQAVLFIERYVDGGLGMVSSAIKYLERRFDWAHKARLTPRWNASVEQIKRDFAEVWVPKIIGAAVSWVLPLLLVPFMAFFCLRDGASFKKRLLWVVPNAYFEKVLLLFYRMDQQIKQYFQGMFWWTLTVGLLLGSVLAFLRVPNPFLLGFIATIIAWVPYVGAAVGCLLIVLVAATDMPQAPQAPWEVIIAFLFVRLIDDFVIIPLTLGRSMSIHPLLTVLVIFLGGEIAGVTGMLLAIPVLGVCAAVTEVALALFADDRLRHRHEQTRKLLTERAQREPY